MTLLLSSFQLTRKKESRHNSRVLPCGARYYEERECGGHNTIDCINRASCLSCPWLLVQHKFNGAVNLIRGAIDLPCSMTLQPGGREKIKLLIAIR
jgi:hypothetical protein